MRGWEEREHDVSRVDTIFTCQLFTLTVLSHFPHSICRHHQPRPIVVRLKGQLTKTGQPLLFGFERKSRRPILLTILHIKRLISFHTRLCLILWQVLFISYFDHSMHRMVTSCRIPGISSSMSFFSK